MRSWCPRLIRFSILGLTALVALIILFVILLAIAGRPIVESHVTIYNSKATKLVRLSLQGMKEVRSGPVTVYHAPSMKGIAKIIAEEMQNILHFLSEKFGFQGVRLSLALFDRARYDLRRTSFRISGKVWPIFISNAWDGIEDFDYHARSQLYMNLPHEAVEGQIGKLIYFVDARARWIGDGLAEYAAFHVALRQAPAVACNVLRGSLREVQELIERGRLYYNLFEDFPVRPKPDRPWTAQERAGYGIAFAFWFRLARQYGDGVIRTFWEEFRALPRFCLFEFCFLGPDAKDAARLLSRQTGESIGSTLRHVELNRVISVLQEARGMACGR